MFRFFPSPAWKGAYAVGLQPVFVSCCGRFCRSRFHLASPPPPKDSCRKTMKECAKLDFRCFIGTRSQFFVFVCPSTRNAALLRFVRFQCDGAESVSEVAMSSRDHHDGGEAEPHDRSRTLPASRQGQPSTNGEESEEVAGAPDRGGEVEDSPSAGDGTGGGRSGASEDRKVAPESHGCGDRSGPGGSEPGGAGTGRDDQRGAQSTTRPCVSPGRYP